MTLDPPWWRADIHADRRSFLMARSRIMAAIRDWFAGQNFIEVDCGALQVSPGNETHLHAFATSVVNPDGSQEGVAADAHGNVYGSLTGGMALKKYVRSGTN